jgi:uncharacterized DUF497 family protein
MKIDPGISDLIWDEWNQDHIWKHLVSVDEVEEILFDRPLVRETYKNRRMLIGRTFSGRILCVVVGPAPGETGVWYVFSARPASRKETREMEALEWE